MKKFFLNLLSSFVGAWIALVCFGILCVMGVIALVARLGTSSETEKIEKESVLVLNLEGTIEEAESAMQLDYVSLLKGNIDKPMTLKSLVRALELAKDDKRISALYIKCNGAAASAATLHALRDAVSGFKKSGKKIYAYGDALSQGDYYVASVADSIFLNPMGNLELRGLGGGTLYMKDLLDKLGVQFQVVKVGKFKSAVEPYLMQQMSEPARAQLDTLYGTMWSYIREEIGKSRKVRPALIDSLINNDYLPIMNAEKVAKTGLIDAVCYERTMDARFARLLDKDEDDLNFVGTETLVAESAFEAGSFSEEVAVLYATGEIVESDQQGVIDCARLVPQITELADDDDVKALVLRVNSPGGSVFGSEQIWEALEYFKSKGKPFAVSMGDVAASGGYYISCGAQRIFADPLTITGSIGIFGLIPQFSGTMAKIGVNPQIVYTNPEGNFPGVLQPLTPGQLNAMQQYVEQGYDLFTRRVAEGRHTTQAKIKAIGEGRVWSATDAKRIGLVDQIGSLQDAVKWAAKKAGLGDDYGVGYYPAPQPSIFDYIPSQGTMVLYSTVESALGPQIAPEVIRRVVRELQRKPRQALIPSIAPTL